MLKMTTIPKDITNVTNDIRWKYANFTDRFVFNYVLRTNLEITKDLILLFAPDLKITGISEVQNEVRVEAAYLAKPDQLDVIVLLEDGRKVLIEMQVRYEKDFVKRTRYYQSSYDVERMKPGNRYGDLENVIQIALCLFDPVGEGKAVYDIEYRDKEDCRIKLNDETRKIYVNAQGNREGLSEEQKLFLDYIAGEETEENEICTKIAREVETMRYNDIERGNFMQWRFSMEESWDQGNEHGLKQGLKQGNEQGKAEMKAEMTRKYYEKLQETGEGRKMTEEELLRNTAEMFDLTVEEVIELLGKQTG